MIVCVPDSQAKFWGGFLKKRPENECPLFPWSLSFPFEYFQKPPDCRRNWSRFGARINPIGVRMRLRGPEPQGPSPPQKAEHRICHTKNRWINTGIFGDPFKKSKRKVDDLLGHHSCESQATFCLFAGAFLGTSKAPPCFRFGDGFFLVLELLYPKQHWALHCRGPDLHWKCVGPVLKVQYVQGGQNKADPGTISLFLMLKGVNFADLWSLGCGKGQWIWLMTLMGLCCHLAFC